MEKFLVLKTVVNLSSANQLCQLLEDAKIPILTEHITLSSHNNAKAIRIYVPSNCLEQAKIILDSHLMLNNAYTEERPSKLFKKISTTHI